MAADTPTNDSSTADRQHSPGPCPSDVGQVCWECNDMPEPPVEPPLAEGTLLRTLREREWLEETCSPVHGHVEGCKWTDAIERVTRLEALAKGKLSTPGWAVRKEIREILGMPQ